MREAVAYMETHGDMVRFPGGYWARGEWAHDGKWFSTPTITALVSRGLADYCAWMDGRRGRFPIRAALSARALARFSGAERRGEETPPAERNADHSEGAP